MKINDNYSKNLIAIKNIDKEVQNLSIKAITAAKKNKLPLAHNYLQRISKRILIIKTTYSNFLKSSESINPQITLLIAHLHDQITLLERWLLMSQEIVTIYNLFFQKKR